MEKKAILYDGHTKALYSTESPDILIMSYKDVVAMPDGSRQDSLEQKGSLNNRISNIIFKHLESKDISTHYIEELDATSTEIKRVDILPFYIVVRNYAAGHFANRMKVSEGTKLKNTTIELAYRAADYPDNIINGYHAMGLSLASESEIERLTSLSFKINDILKSYFDSLNIDLIDFRLTFGRHKSELILADELSPDTCRLWDKTTHEKLDIDRYIRNLGHVRDAYQEIYNRLANARG